MAVIDVIIYCKNIDQKLNQLKQCMKKKKQALLAFSKISKTDNTEQTEWQIRPCQPQCHKELTLTDANHSTSLLPLTDMKK